MVPGLFCRGAFGTQPNSKMEFFARIVDDF